MSNEKIDAFCPECNTVVAAEVRAEAHNLPTADLFEHLPSQEDGFRGVRYRVAFCPSCHSAFLQRKCTTEPSELPFEEILYPQRSKSTPPGLPDPIRRAFESASACFETAQYEPSVIMCRKCLEGVCAAFEITNGNLKKRLAALRDSGIIDERLFSWSDQLRLVGNDAAHDLNLRVSKDDAQDSLDFVEAIVVYVFTLEKKFRAFQERRDQPK